MWVKYKDVKKILSLPINVTTYVKPYKNSAVHEDEDVSLIICFTQNYLESKFNSWKEVTADCIMRGEVQFVKGSLNVLKSYIYL